MTIGRFTRHQGKIGEHANAGARAARITSLAVALAALPFLATAETRSYHLTGFDGVSASSGIHVIVDVGEDFSVIAESEDPVQLERLEVDVRRGTLRLRMDPRLFALRRTRGWRVTVNVSLPDLIHADASSGAWIEIDDMAGEGLELITSSGARVQVDRLAGTAITATASSGARIDAEEGECSELEVQVSSGANIDLASVQCANVGVSASSGASASVFADDRIDVTASSGGTVQVHGAHDDIEINSSSGGDVVFH